MKKNVAPFVAAMILQIVFVAFFTALQPDSIRISFFGTVIEFDFRD